MKKFNINIYTIILCLLINIITIGFYHYFTYDNIENSSDNTYYNNLKEEVIYKNKDLKNTITSKNYIELLAIFKGVQGLGQNIRFYDIENDIYYECNLNDKFILKNTDIKPIELYKIGQNEDYFIFIIKAIELQKLNHKSTEGKSIYRFEIIEITPIKKE